MNDRELLELAAKAAGIEYRYEPNSHRFLIEKPTLIAGGQYLAYWNPLTDDGDALRLAVKLEISLESRLKTTQARAEHYRSLTLAQSRDIKRLKKGLKV